MLAGAEAVFLEIRAGACVDVAVESAEFDAIGLPEPAFLAYDLVVAERRDGLVADETD